MDARLGTIVQGAGSQPEESPSAGPDPLQWLTDPAFWDRATHAIVAWTAVALLAWLSNVVARRVIVRGTRALAARTKSKWDDALAGQKVFERLSQLAPALVVYSAAPLLLDRPEDAVLADWVRRFANVWMILAGARALHALLDAIVSARRAREDSRYVPVRSYVQVAQLVLWIAAGVLAVAVLMQKSPTVLLTGLGAMTAVLLLVFRDTILGLVASIQIESNETLRVGDWVEMPKYGADGDVLEVGLHTVKIQNWDKTITAIPTHAFLSDSFKNWRGMAESGGRRIKRALKIDMTSVRFLGTDDVTRLEGIASLRPYLEERSTEVERWNTEHGVKDTSPLNGRRLTNLGTFRAYVEAYLRGLEPIREDMTFLVRQLAPTTEGIPLEIYCFSGEQRWIPYESLMGDIFDHLLASLPEFGLRVYQSPAGHDLATLAAGRAG
ncbi:MAG: mechanosensitive ion channel family protein [Planctomycetota bacterium]